MKQTKQTTKETVDKTEILCELSQSEFANLCAETAATVVVSQLGDKIDGGDIIHGLHLTAFLAKFVHELDNKLFTYTNENPDKKEEQ